MFVQIDIDALVERVTALEERCARLERYAQFCTSVDVSRTRTRCAECKLPWPCGHGSMSPCPHCQHPSRRTEPY